MTEPSYSNPPAQTSTLAVVSLISGILSWFMLPLIGGIVAVITGHLALRDLHASAGRLTGEGMAKAGLALGYLHLGILLLGFCLISLLIALGVIPLICIPFANQFSLWLQPVFGF